MAEDVQTGGFMSFRHGRGSNFKLDDKRKKEIQEAYAQFYERKALEKRNRTIFWILTSIALIILGFVVWRFIL